MPLQESFYKERYGREFKPGTELPTISTDLDSVRAYQFEIRFTGLPADIGNFTDLTLAAKKISGLEISNEAIVVDRVNDKINYPGKTSPKDLVVEFDNLYLKETASTLWRYFKTVYDPITGEMTKNAPPNGNGFFKAAKAEIVMLDHTLRPHSVVEIYGVYPSSWSAAEFNYSTNQFHTLTVNFKYDFMNVYNYSNPQ